MTKLDPKLIARLRQIFREEFQDPHSAPAPVLPEKFLPANIREVDLAWLEQLLRYLPLLLPGKWKRYAWLYEMVLPLVIKRGPAVIQATKEKIPEIDREAIRNALLKIVVELRQNLAQARSAKK